MVTIFRCMHSVSSRNIAGERYGESRTHAEPVAPHRERSTVGFADSARDGETDPAAPG
jgi:hypothetical protein